MVTHEAVLGPMALFFPVFSGTALNYCITGSSLWLFEDPQYLTRHIMRGNEWDTIHFEPGVQVGDVADRVPPI